MIEKILAFSAITAVLIMGVCAYHDSRTVRRARVWWLQYRKHVVETHISAVQADLRHLKHDAVQYQMTPATVAIRESVLAAEFRSWKEEHRAIVEKLGALL